jgi:hypothetical protein
MTGLIQRLLERNEIQEASEELVLITESEKEFFLELGLGEMIKDLEN